MRLHTKAAPPGGEYYVFRDIVHNLIAIDEPLEGKLLRRILRTPQVQRLRRIKQNGLSSYVYPSMEHSRFAHSLGSYAVARRLVRGLVANQPKPGLDGIPQSLLISDRAGRAFCISALLHDVGHAPFSHVWEDFLSDISENQSASPHEDISRTILECKKLELVQVLQGLSNEPDLSHLVDENVYGQVLSFLSSSHPITYLNSLLSGYLDIDRLEYMARDTRTAGVTYGFEELEWIVRSLRIVRHPGTLENSHGQRWIIAIDSRKGLYTLEQFLASRANLYRQVYLHKTVRAAGAQLRSILRRASHPNADCPSFGLKQFLSAPRSFPATSYLNLDDADVWTSIKHWSEESADPILKQLSQEFLARQLFKVITLSHAQFLQLEKVAGHINHIVAARMGLSTDKDAASFWRLDRASFDHLGKAPTDGEQIFIVNWGRFGPTLKDLRTYWSSRIKQHSDVSHPLNENHYYLIGHREVMADLMTIADKVGANDAPSSEGVNSVVPKGYDILSKLGSGKIKDTWLAIRRDGNESLGKMVALKLFRDGSVQTLAHEAIAEHLSGPSAHIVRSEVVHTLENGNPCIIEDLWYGTLRDLVIEQGRMKDIKDILNIMKHLFSGLRDLHGKNLRHGDLKLDNCGIVQSGHSDPLFQIGDFGCLTSQPERIPTSDNTEGSLRTLPPELLREPRKVGLKSDVWSLAATAYALMMGRYPFLELLADTGEPGSDLRRSVRSRLENSLNEKLDAFRVHLEQDVPPILGRVLAPCFAELEHRQSAEAALKQIEENCASLQAAEKKTPDARAVWERSEMVLILLKKSGKHADKKLLEEATALADVAYEDFIPKAIRDQLSAHEK